MKKLSIKDLKPNNPLFSSDISTSNDIPTDLDVIGQETARDALLFGLNMPFDGYHILCIGSNGIGKKHMALQLARKVSSTMPAGEDWCYAPNFEHPYRPLSLSFPSGKGKFFVKEIQHLLALLKEALPTLFFSKEYLAEYSKIKEYFKKSEENFFKKIQQLSKGRKNVSVMKTSAGVVVAPLYYGKVLDSTSFDKLPLNTRKKIIIQMQSVQQELQKIPHPDWEKEEVCAINSLKEHFIRQFLKNAFKDLEKKYIQNQPVASFLNTLSEDIFEHVDFWTKQPFDDTLLSRYQIDLFLKHSSSEKAPVVLLQNPTLPALLGQIEADKPICLIKPGALHLANGGFLIIELADLIDHPKTFAALKKAVKTKKIFIEQADDDRQLNKSFILEPQAIDLNIKIILITTPETLNTFVTNDPDFYDLFKVHASFTDSLDLSKKMVSRYLTQLSTLVHKYHLHPLTKEAMTDILRYSQRLTQNQKKLSAISSEISSLIKEANYISILNKSKNISHQHIQTALDNRNTRNSLTYKKLLEKFKKQIIQLDLSTPSVGQINILSVFTEMGQSFGRVYKLSVSSGIGQGKIIDIERDACLGGPIHSKGILILSSLIHGLFAQKVPLSMSAYIAIEQSYNFIDGDSASCAEAFALISSLADTPINQSFACTGSINSMGQIQAIGCVNEKIEGFFDCAQAINPEQKISVLIPASNVENLVLRNDVIEAVRKGLLTIYAIDNLDEGLELLTGVKAKEIFNRATKKLEKFYKIQKDLK